jgi:hypothetical protein
MGSKKKTIGYRYFMAILSGLCRGPINEFVEWKAADKTAWTGPITTNTLSSVNKPNLFGGEKKEGGLQGPFYLAMGGDTQVYPGAQGSLPDVKTSIGTGLVSEFRGVVTLWFDGLVSAMNPYIKEWKFRVRRWDKGWWQDNPWYPAKSVIYLSGGQIKAMNGAHMIYECCTNPQWGRGLPATQLDENSFIAAANTLCAETFGLCLAWYRKEDIDVFINKILDLIGGVLYTDRETGLVVLRLIRDDYDPDDLPLFTPDSGLLDIKEDDSGSTDSSYNEVIGTGRDPITNQDFQMRAQNLASFQAQQSVSSLDQDYRGIPTKELLGRVVLRDMRANAVGLKRYTVVLDRRAWRLAPGMPFRVSDPNRGVSNIVLRAGEIDDGDMINGRITAKTVQDVFGLPSTSYVVPSEPGWTPPPTVALPAAEERLVEASYRDIYRIVGSGDAETAPVDAAYIGQLAIAPNTTSYQYDLATKADGEPDYEVQATGSFTGNAKLTADISETETSVVLSDLQSFSVDNLGEAMYLGDELVRLDALDEGTSTATIARGVGDTIPQPHSADDILWTIDDDLINDGRVYTEGETVFAKVLTRISSDVLDLADATEQSLVMVARQGRPYPPSDVKVDGTSIYSLTGEHGEPVLTWGTRNRITQADQLVSHSEASVAPEAGTTYNIRVYDPTDLVTPLRTVTGLSATTWTYDATMQAADNPPSYVFMELESERDGIVSWQHYHFRVILQSGWGYGWGLNWGGTS